MEQIKTRPLPGSGKPNRFNGNQGVIDANRRIAESIIDPVRFVHDFLQADLWEVPAKIVAASAVSPRVAVKACHASGKTFTAARAVLWNLARFPEVVVVTTAPTWNQVEKILWGEIHTALAKSRYPFPKPLTTEIKMGPKRMAYGLATSVTKQDEGVKFQGIHADRVLVVLDEAPGVDPKIWEAIEGARAGGNVSVLAIGNPTIASGPFYDAFTENRSGWVTFTIDAFDTPNLKGITLDQLLLMSDAELDADEQIAPYLTRRRWVKEKFFEWGEDHPSWQSRVRGQFPKQSEDALLSLAWLENAAIRDLPTIGECTAGLDVAGPGEDETSLTIRKGPRVIYQNSWAQQDPRGDVVAALQPYKNELTAVNVDSIGIGWGMYQHLLDLKYPAVAVNITEQAGDTEKYFNQKAEFYWGLRLRLKDGDFCGLTDEKTIGQLAGIRYKHNARGQIEIESKEQAAKRGVKSPDRAESVMLAFAKRDLVFGALEYYKSMKVQTSILQKPAIAANTPACPGCGAVCVVICGHDWRCNQCGKQWEAVKQSLQSPAKRGEWLAKHAR